MQPFTLDDLRRVMRKVADQGTETDISGPIDDVAFDELGYDSLAMLELQVQLNQQLAIRVPDDATDRMPTPAAAVSYVNALLAAEEKEIRP